MFLKDRLMSIKWLVVFLGNPGQEYHGTRHNVGFMTADVVEQAHNIRIHRVRFHALTAKCQIGGEQVLLMKPQTYMNLSGEAVIEAVKFYKIPADHVLVVMDDVALPVGKLRIRAKGSAGGHNGIKDIIHHLQTERFPRIKIGVGAPPHPDYDMADWVLGKFQGSDAEAVDEAVKRAASAIPVLIEEGVATAMNQFN
ncbi:MAG: aminoacyl-tRNA hydrolase [Oscillospiraceae bacterium]|jgi:PTH1 family peptidyl-tRNA hydrolase